MENYSSDYASMQAGQKASLADRAYGVGAIGNAQTVQPAAPTLVRALAQLDELNKRLYQLHTQANEIASSVGGPYPCGVDPNAKENGPVSAMQRLNDSLQMAHGTVSNLEGALGAMRRALGA